jgi:hypothetical protein
LLGTSSTKIIVNEDLSDPVLQRRNLRHCLGRLLDKAQEDMILSQTGPQILRFRASFYTNDVIIFLRPHWQDLRVTVAILDLFGAATGLFTNMAKRDNIFPIACQDVDLTFTATVSDCAAADFFCKYLGLPLSGKKLKRTKFQQLIVKLMKKLAWWKARITVLSALPAYQLIAILHPKWLLKQLEKISVPSSGLPVMVFQVKCLVNLNTVYLLKQLSGLGIPNLHLQSIALRMRWLWQQHFHGMALD